MNRVREEHPAAGAVRRHRPGRSQPVGDDSFTPSSASISRSTWGSRNGRAWRRSGSAGLPAAGCARPRPGFDRSRISRRKAYAVAAIPAHRPEHDLAPKVAPLEIRHGTAPLARAFHRKARLCNRARRDPYGAGWPGATDRGLRVGSSKKRNLDAAGRGQEQPASPELGDRMAASPRPT
jgi:hypothetical protein